MTALLIRIYSVFLRLDARTRERGEAGSVSLEQALWAAGLALLALGVFALIKAYVMKHVGSLN